MALVACRYPMCLYNTSFFNFRQFPADAAPLPNAFVCVEIRFTCFFVSFFYPLNERNFVLTFFHSGIRVYYNQYIQSKVIIQPEESDTTLHLHGVMHFFSLCSSFSTRYFSIIVHICFLCMERFIKDFLTLNLKNILSRI